MADLVDDPTEIRPITRDAGDDYVVALARANAADVIVSGDLDLLEWDEQSPSVLTPAEFEHMLGRADERRSR
jgi:predicted nucleic acid-binding protein